MEEARRFKVSSSPHVRQQQTVTRVMVDVVIALVPATLFGIYRFGLHALYVMLASVASAVLFEAGLERLFKMKLSIFDGSAVVTGMLIGMCCPPDVPIWLPVAGSFFAIAIVKLPFGGLGGNFLNPALAARGFLLASWPQLMTTWKFAPAEVATSATATSQATALVAIQNGTPTSIIDMLIGNMAGTIGEVCKIGLIIGFVYLMVRKVVGPHVPLGYLGTVFILTWVLGGADGLFSGDGLYALLSGGVMLGALFMATDYTTSPVTHTGQLIMGIGAGLITFLIRAYGNYPEGVTYAILFMNVCTPLIDKWVKPRLYGEVKDRA